MPDHDDEDDGASGPPPDPLDRLWFHPSELRSFLGSPTRSTRAPQHRRSALVGLAAAGALVATVGLVVVSGALDSANDTALPGGIDALGGGAAARVVAIAGASVVTVQVTRADGTTTASGVCIDNEVVLTSAHALEGATAVTVVAQDETSLPAVAAGADPETDLALLRVDSLAVPAARAGSSDDLREGHAVLAVATGTRSKPQWVSVGTVEGLDEFVVTAAGTVIVGLIDTGTSAGRRHSGGAVIDERGRLVGILTVPRGASPGLAMPIDTARDVAEQLAATGKAAHAWLGVTGADETERAGGGARVDEVLPASPAEKAGIASGDVIVAVSDGESTTSVSSMADLMAEVRDRRPGHSLELTVLRDGAKRHMPVALSHKTGPDDADVLTTTTTLAAPPKS
ncbi:MAG: S1C family serine protease [Actinomycetota bacterium]